MAYAASFAEWFGEEAKRVYGDLIPQHAPGKRILVMKQPVRTLKARRPLRSTVPQLGSRTSSARA